MLGCATPTCRWKDSGDGGYARTAYFSLGRLLHNAIVQQGSSIDLRCVGGSEIGRAWVLRPSHLRSRTPRLARRAGIFPPAGSLLVQTIDGQRPRLSTLARAVRGRRSEGYEKVFHGRGSSAAVPIGRNCSGSRDGMVSGSTQTHEPLQSCSPSRHADAAPTWNFQSRPAQVDASDSTEQVELEPLDPGDAHAQPPTE